MLPPTSPSPPPATLAHLRPRRARGALHMAGCCAALGLGLLLARGADGLGYALSQVVLALAFVHAFVLLHEAGHYTLLPGRRANRIVGSMAGFVALIPFQVWQPIHARHHRYTGWQDLDATTAALVPRALGRLERLAVDLAWRLWLPLFSLVYRVQNYWNLRRIRPFLGNVELAGRARAAIAVHASAYAVLVLLAGPLALAKLVGPALLLSWMIQDVLLLSQHTHVPQQISHGAAVRPFSPLEQARFTRSLRLPAALSRLLLHFDLHELHHMYPNVPGYLLNRIDYVAPNTVHWLTWIRAAKRLPGSVFLFSNRDQTGAPV